MSDFRLYIDSDGVNCDFIGKVVEIVGRPRHEISNRQLWSAVDHYDSCVAPFFESLEMLPDADKLLDFAVNNFKEVAILTATGRTPKDVGAQKKRWYAKNFPHLDVILVESSGDKAAYACPKSILVDDRSHSIDPWTAAGGIGVLHTSVQDTIERLRQYL